MPGVLAGIDLQEPIGRGAFSDVWRAIDRRDGRTVAVKVLRSAPDPAALAALREEARAVAALDHPAIVEIYDQGRSADPLLPEGAACLVMDWADEGTLEGWEPAAWDELRALLASLLDALGHAHARGVLHLDLKAANILRCGADHPRPGPKLSDFGASAGGLRPPAGRLTGTPRTMSPEQIAGRPHAFGPWTDLYALGAVAFHLATGRHAVPGDTLVELVFAHEQGRRTPFVPRFPVPVGFGAWLAWLLAADGRDRPMRAIEAARALTALDGSSSPPAAPRTLRSRPRVGGGLLGLRPTPLVGRAAEQAALEGWLNGGGEGPSCVVLEGVAGAGKSRLARWIAQEAEEHGAAVSLFVPHGEGGRGGIGAALRAGLGLDLSVDPRAELEDRLGPGAPLDEAAAALGLGGAPFESAPERWAAQAQLLAAWAQGRTPLVVLDDAHANIDAIGFARWLLDAGDRSPLAAKLVLTAQTEALAERAEAAVALTALSARPGATTVRIRPLPRRERLPFLDALLPLEGEAAARVLERCGGNPLHAEQLVAAWLEEGVLAPGRLGFRLVGARAHAAGDHAAMCGVRLRRVFEGLEAAQRRALELAAVLGDPVDGAEWASLCAGLGLPADAGLDLLARAGLVRGGQRRFSFAHGSVREAVLREAEAGGRLEGLHDAVAGALRAGREVDRARLGRHLLGAGRAVEAASLLLAAAADAEERSDASAAAVLLDEQVHAADRAGLPAGHPSRALACALRAAAVRGQGRFAEAEALARRARELALVCGDPAALARAHLELGRCCVNTGEHGDAAESLEQARALALLIGDAEGAARATRMLGIARKQLGDLDAADGHLEDALARWERLKRPIRAGWCALGRAQVAKQRGDLPSVERWLQRARASFVAGGGRAGLASVDNDEGELHRLHGRLAEAEERYRAALAWARAHASSDAVVVEANLGLLLLEAGRGREAAELLGAAQRTFRGQGRRELAATVGLALAGCAALDGTHAGWRAHWPEAVEAISATRFTYYEVARVAEIAADRALARGWRTEARAALILAEQQWGALERSADRDRVGIRLDGLRA